MIYGNTYDSRVLEDARSTFKDRSEAASHRVSIIETQLSRSNWILQTSCVMWKSSKICGVKLEVFEDPYFSRMQGAWTGFDVDVSRFVFVHAH